MRRFHFGLESLLKHRKRKRDFALTEVHAKSHEIDLVHRDIEQCHQERERAREESYRQTEKNPVHMAFIDNFIKGLEIRTQRKKLELRDLQVEFQRLQDKLRELQVAVKALENLKDKRKAEYLHEIQRNENLEHEEIIGLARLRAQL